MPHAPRDAGRLGIDQAARLAVEEFETTGRRRGDARAGEVLGPIRQCGYSGADALEELNLTAGYVQEDLMELDETLNV